MFAATQQIASVAGLKATKVQSKSVSKVVKADIYPEFGTYPGGGESPIIPLGLAESGDLEELKIKELKHCRLSMFAWLGCIMQGLATQEGPIANWQAHVADPVHANVLTNAASGFGFY